jgi:hypothetical protein
MATLFTFNLSRNMNYFYLFLGAGIVIVLLIIFYDIQNRKKVNDILRANKNVPPLFMLRSVEIKVSAIKSVLNNSGYVDAEIEETKYDISLQLDKLVTSYKNRELPLTAYYAKIGSLLISANKLKASITENTSQVHRFVNS